MQKMFASQAIQAEPNSSNTTDTLAPVTTSPIESKAASAPVVADQTPAPTGGAPHGTTATGIPTYVGPRGGVYQYSRNGNKVYERRNSGGGRRGRRR